MYVLHVTHQYPPAIGGSEKYIADLSEELVERGHKVDAFTSRSLDYRTWKNELPPREERNGVSVRRFRSMRRTDLVWRVLHWSQGNYWKSRSRIYEPLILFGGGPLCPGMFTAMLRKLPAYDLVHLNCLVYGHVIYGYLAARWRKVPVVVTPHIHPEQEVTYGVRYQLNVLRGCDHVVAVSDGEREFLLGLGLEPWHVTTAGNGLRPASYPLRDIGACRRRLGIPEEAFVMLFLGRQVEYKGLRTVLDAFIALRERHPHVHLLVVGPETTFSRKLFSQHSALQGVTNLGRVPDDVRLDALNACDCLVLPSEGEAFGIVFLEAWILRKPVIGPNTKAVSTVIRDDRDGWLVPLNDPSAIATAVDRWIAAPELARCMGEAGRCRVLQRYTQTSVADRVEGVYLQTLRARHRASAA
ncbi:MAG: glycosyltransferase family 4 protein [Anaerolineae bacterium]|jgi:glycosyltransferase involved in cell wall biosynthesis